MNKRIQELAEQARSHATTRHPVSNVVLSVNSEKFEEKFAQLIVEECIKQARSVSELRGVTDDMIYGADTAVLKIMNHFGVEDD